MKPRILIISTIVPYPPDRGHRIRIYYLIKQLLPSFRVGLLTMAFSQAEYQNARKLGDLLPEIDPFRIVRSPAHENTAARIRGAFLSRVGSFPGKPLEMYYHAPKRLRHAFEKLYALFHPHMIQCVYWFTRGVVPRAIDSSVLIDSIDIHWRRARTAHTTDSNRIITGIDRVRSRLIRTQEIAAYESVDRVLAIHDAETEILSSVITTPVSTLPLSCGIPDEPLIRDPEPVICFIGPMDYHPNRDAVRFLADSVLPRVRSHIPDARLRVIGRLHGSRSLPRNDRVEYSGHVADLDSALRTVSAGVAPIRSGAGINVKVITLLSRGVPVVASGNAVEGIPVRNGIEYLRADDAGTWAAAIVKLLTDGTQADVMGKRGYTAARSSFSWKTNAAEVGRLYREWLG